MNWVSIYHLYMQADYYKVASNQGHQGIQVISESFMLIQGKTRGKERFFKKRGKVKEVLSFLLSFFKGITFSVLNHTSS